MMLPFSKWGLAKHLNKVSNISLSISSKDRLISPKMPFAF